MQDSSEVHSGISYNTPFCDVALGKYFPHILPSESSNSIFSCENPFRKNIVTCKDLQIDSFLNESGGLELNRPLSSHIPTLPPYIPVFDIRTRDISNLSSDEFSVIGLTLRDIVKRGVKLTAGTLQEQQDIQLYSQILDSKSFLNRKVILFLTGPDTLIEWIWWNRIDCDLFKTIKSMGFWAVTGFNFSVINGECAFAQALNQKRSLVSSSLIEEIGLLTIPHIYAISQHHISRWVTWLSLNPAIKLFSINCQLQKRQEDINQIIRSVKGILEKVPTVHVLLQGFHLPLIWKFGIYLERIHFADAAPIKYAQNHKHFITDSKKALLNHEYVRGKAFPELVIDNIRNRQLYIECVRSQIFNGQN